MRSVVLCEKASQAANIRAAIGTKYGPILPASGHLYALAVPDHYGPEWADWHRYEVYRPRQWQKVPTPGNDAGDSKRLDGLREAIRAALAGADRAIIATDADREGEVIGHELLEANGFTGEAFRVLFPSEDPASIIDAFARLIPLPEREPIYRAGLARERADFIWNFSLTRAATTALRSADQSGAIGIGRVKTPTLGIVCRREAAVASWQPSASQVIRAEIETPAGKIGLTSPADNPYPTADAAKAAIEANQTDKLTVAVRTETKRQAPPRPPDLTLLQITAAKWGWTAEKTLETGQALYSTHKIITYIRASTRAYPTALIETIPGVLADLKAAGIGPLPETPTIRRAKTGTFSDEALAGESHHAIAPNPKTTGELTAILPRLSADERRLFDHIAALFIECLMPDHEYESSSITASFDGRELAGTVTRTITPGWRAVRRSDPSDDTETAPEIAAPIEPGDYPVTALTFRPTKAKPPSRLNHGSLISAMATAWTYVQDEAKRARLKEAKGIGTVATRDQVIRGLVDQKQLVEAKKNLVPSQGGFDLFTILYRIDPRLVDPGTTAEWELKIDDIARGGLDLDTFLDEIEAETSRLVDKIRSETPKIALGPNKLPTPGMIKAIEAIQRAKRIIAPAGWLTSYTIASEFLTVHATKKDSK